MTPEELERRACELLGIDAKKYCPSNCRRKERVHGEVSQEECKKIEWHGGTCPGSVWVYPTGVALMVLLKADCDNRGMGYGMDKYPNDPKNIKAWIYVPRYFQEGVAFVKTEAKAATEHAAFTAAFVKAREEK